MILLEYHRAVKKSVADPRSAKQSIAEYCRKRVIPLEKRPGYSEDALRLRSALKYDPQRTRVYVENGWWADDTLTGWVAKHASERGEDVAVISSNEKISWKDLQDRSLKFAEGLRRAGIARGDVVAVQLPNTLEFVVAFLGICRLGAVMCTLHMPYRGAEIEALLRHSRARLGICLSKENFQGIGRTFAELDSPELLSKDVPGPVAADPYLLLYTSGTTASPKGVPLNYHAMLSNARLGVPEHRLSPQDRILSAAPFTHLFGLYALHCAWSVGAASVLLPAFKPGDLSLIIENLKPSALWTAPAHIAACRAMGLFDKHDWSSLRLAIMSGSACPPPLVRFFSEKAKNCAVTQLWGMTEMQAGLYTRRGDAPEVHATSAGRPSPGTEIRIVDNELQVRGCLLFPGYFDNEQANREAFTPDGWFRAGDLAAMDAAGNVSITGRSKDVINRGGVKFNPRDVEDLLAMHPKILMAAIVPMPDPVLGEKACVFAVLKEKDSVLSLDEIISYLKEKNIAKNKFPERLVVVAEMPLTPTRKIIKGRLKIPPA
jgi:acyl-CoA synthetase (AMP-forming)/AMP-acid ligase II